MVRIITTKQFFTIDLSLQSVKLRGGLPKLNVREFQDLSLDLEKLNKEYREIVLNNNDGISTK